MILRCSLTRTARQCVRRTNHARSRATFKSAARRYSSASTSSAPEASTSNALASFGSLTGELDRLAPRFEVEANQIQILREPKDFYNALKSRISSARRRIFISTLYIGKTENELLDTIRAALRRSPDLKVSITTDYLRGTRETPDRSCASLLSELVSEFGEERVEVNLLHTPNLTGIRKRLLPKRINEGWGLQHMKLYGFDDEIILSGANLSNDYFTNRQDRYHLFSSREITDYFQRIHSAVASISFRLKPLVEDSAKFELNYPATQSNPSPLEDSRRYISHATNLLAPLLKPQQSQHTKVDPHLDVRSSWPAAKTFVYPVSQFTALFSASHRDDAHSTELPALTHLLRSLSFAPFRPAWWTFTAGYFNMTPGIRELLLSSLAQTNATKYRSTTEPQPQGTIITAHPEANGFYASKGVSGMLPDAYTLMSKRFLEYVKKEGMQQRLALHEWKRGIFGVDKGDDERWTYHAKGLWVTMPPTPDAPQREQPGPSITIIGSSNYTKRSHTLDLETNALVLTTDPDLQRRLKEEEQHLMTYAGSKTDLKEFDKEDRQVSWKVRASLFITNLIGGAL